MVNLDGKLTQSEFGDLIGISQQAVSNLIGRGVLDQNQSGAAMLRAYCAHIREVAAGRDNGGQLNLTQERAKLARASTVRVSLQNGERQKRLVDVSILTALLAQAGAKITGQLAAIPGTIRRKVPALSNDDLKTIELEIVRAQNVAASMTIADFLEAQ